MNFVLYFIRRAKLTYPKILDQEFYEDGTNKFQFLTCDYLIVILLLPGDVFRF